MNTLLDFLRGAVRPITLLALIGATIGFLQQGKMEEAKVIITLAGPVLGYWFAERARNKH